MRNRSNRTKGDENATSKHARQPSSGRLSNMVNVHALKNGLGLSQPRAALGEVTTAAVNRNKVCFIVSLLTSYADAHILVSGCRQEAPGQGAR